MPHVTKQGGQAARDSGADLDDLTRPRADDALGLDSAADFITVRGRDAADVAGRHAAWYFADETVAIARPGLPVASFATRTRPFNDVRLWSEAHPVQVPSDLPPLVWLGAPDALRGARISGDAGTIATAERTRAFRLVPKLPLNRSWFDSSSAAFFTTRNVAVRATVTEGDVIARSLWPEDFRLGPTPPPLRPLPAAATPGQALRALVRDAHAATPFEAGTLWERRAYADWQGKAVLAFVLNGAQGDDDEAHAGHFAIATGCIAGDGAIGDWLVHNFYALDTESEKGILAAPVPLANYHGDLNAGQSWYRPSWVLVAVLDSERAARRVQAALGRVYRQFWRHQLAYYHPTDNCTSMSIDTLRALGLGMPLTGPTSRIGAWLAFPALAARERSLAKARITFDYLVTERTRLLPALAQEAVFDALSGLVAAGARANGALGRELAQDLCAIAWLAMPQFPSSRALGGPPVSSLAEYRARLPDDPGKRVIVPVPPRPFPEALHDDDLLPPLPHPSDLAVRTWAVVPLAVIAAALVVLLR